MAGGALIIIPSFVPSDVAAFLAAINRAPQLFAQPVIFGDASRLSIGNVSVAYVPPLGLRLMP